jgi:hypothetical protein
MRNEGEIKERFMVLQTDERLDSVRRYEKHVLRWLLGEVEG